MSVEILTGTRWAPKSTAISALMSNTTHYANLITSSNSYSIQCFKIRMKVVLPSSSSYTQYGIGTGYYYSSRTTNFPVSSSTGGIWRYEPYMWSGLEFIDSNNYIFPNAQKTSYYSGSSFSSMSTVYQEISYIEFLDGDDIANPNFISWLEANFNLIYSPQPKLVKINNKTLTKLNNKNINLFNRTPVMSGLQLYDYNQVGENLILNKALYTKEDDEITII